MLPELNCSVLRVVPRAIVLLIYNYTLKRRYYQVVARLFFSKIGKRNTQSRIFAAMQTICSHLKYIIKQSYHKMDIQRYNRLFFTFFRIVHNVEIAGLILSKMTQKMRPIT